MGEFQRVQGKVSFGACVLLVFFLSACDAKAPVEPAEVPSSAPKVEVGEEAKNDSSSELPVQESEVNQKKPKKKLNLTLPEDVMAPSISGSAVSIDVAENSLNEKNTLPNMFGGKQEGTTVGGGILRDSENEDYVDSIQGAEVSVEFKID